MNIFADMSDAPNRLNIAVLLGGINSEREISLESGHRVMEAVQTLGHDAVPVVYEGDLATAIDILKDYDLVFNALHGGEGEDGTVQAALERAGIRYTGSRAAASRLAMDKISAKERMAQAGIPTPPWVSLELEQSTDFVRHEEYTQLRTFLAEHSFPLVVKPNHEGSTVGLSIVELPYELDAALLLASEFGPQVLVEVFIPGRELTATILDQRPLPIVEIIPKHTSYDYECKYTDGMSSYHVPADLPLKVTVAIQDAAQRLYSDLKCRHYARVDFRLNPADEFFCLEINTLPGMTSHSLTPMAAQAVGIGFVELIDRIIQLALAES